MRHSFARAALVLLCFAGHCTATPSARKLISGEASRVEPGEYPNVVKIILNFGEQNGGRVQRNFCTGTLISPGAILTAAHCMEQPGGVLLYKDILGENEQHLASYVVFPGKTEKIYIQNWWLHPWYTSGMLDISFHDDIAVLGLYKCIKDTVPVTLSQSDNLACKAGETVGYGATNGAGEFYDPTHKQTGILETKIARKTTLRIHSAKTCDQIHNHFFQQAFKSNNQDLINEVMKMHGPELYRHYRDFYGDDMSGLERGRMNSAMLRRIDQQINYLSSDFCVTPTTDSFQQNRNGDSGAPIFVDGKQVGVFSSYLYISRGILAKYGMVSSHLGWIKGVVQKLNDCGVPKTLSVLKRRLSFPMMMPRRKLVTTKQYHKDLLQLTKAKAWSIIDLMYEKDQCPLREAAQAGK